MARRTLREPPDRPDRLPVVRDAYDAGTHVVLEVHMYTRADLEPGTHAVAPNSRVYRALRGMPYRLLAPGARSDHGGFPLAFERKLVAMVNRLSKTRIPYTVGAPALRITAGPSTAGTLVNCYLRIVVRFDKTADADAPHGAAAIAAFCRDFTGEE